MASLLETHRQKLIYQAALLGSVCFLVSLFLLVGNKTTQPAIDFHINNDRKILLEQVLPSGLYDNDPLAETIKLEESGTAIESTTLYIARKNNVINGAGVASTIQGWGGEIDFILAVNVDGEITGVRIISHKETPGLADKIEIEKASWITSFNGRSLSNTPEVDWAVAKDGGAFDQFTGATITPRAVVRGVHESLVAYDEWRSQQYIKPVAEEVQ